MFKVSRKSDINPIQDGLFLRLLTDGEDDLRGALGLSSIIWDWY